jgi:cyclin H
MRENREGATRVRSDNKIDIEMKSLMLPNKEAIERQRKRVYDESIIHESIIHESIEGDQEEASRLSFQESQQLLSFYEGALRDFWRSFSPPLAPKVLFSAVVYFKRFFLRESLLDFEPKAILVTSVFLATKVLEVHVSLQDFVSNVKGDRGKAVQVILDHELTLMSRLDFRLQVQDPFKALDTLLAMMSRAGGGEEGLHRIRRSSFEILLEEVLLTDACLLFTPSQVCLLLHLFIHSFLHSFTSIVTTFLPPFLPPLPSPSLRWPLE